MWLWLIRIQTKCQLIIPIGHSKTMWQWKWLNLVANFATNASDATMEVPKTGCGQLCNSPKTGWKILIFQHFIWWANLQLMQLAPSGGKICKKFHWNQFQTIIVERFTQVMDSIPWVRCASGNVYWTTRQQACDIEVGKWEESPINLLAFLKLIFITFFIKTVFQHRVPVNIALIEWQLFVFFCPDIECYL